MSISAPLKTHLPELFQQKNKEKNISGAFNYSRRLLHTHAGFYQTSNSTVFIELNA